MNMAASFFTNRWEKTVEEIGENLESEYGDATHPLYERLTMYFKPYTC